MDYLNKTIINKYGDKICLDGWHFLFCEHKYSLTTIYHWCDHLACIFEDKEIITKDDRLLVSDLIKEATFGFKYGLITGKLLSIKENYINKFCKNCKKSCLENFCRTCPNNKIENRFCKICKKSRLENFCRICPNTEMEYNGRFDCEFESNIYDSRLQIILYKHCIEHCFSVKLESLYHNNHLLVSKINKYLNKKITARVCYFRKSNKKLKVYAYTLKLSED